MGQHNRHRLGLCPQQQAGGKRQEARSRVTADTEAPVKGRGPTGLYGLPRSRPGPGRPQLRTVANSQQLIRRQDEKSRES
mgnify:CR=1 FL=1